VTRCGAQPQGIHQPPFDSISGLPGPLLTYAAPPAQGGGQARDRGIQNHPSQKPRSGSNSATGSRGVTKKPTRRTPGTACTSCRSVGARCDPVTKDLCQRCSRTGQKCVMFSGSNAHRRQTPSSRSGRAESWAGSEVSQLYSDRLLSDPSEADGVILDIIDV
jgi:hypothetical protein